MFTNIVSLSASRNITVADKGTLFFVNTQSGTKTITFPTAPDFGIGFIGALKAYPNSSWVECSFADSDSGAPLGGWLHYECLQEGDGYWFVSDGNRWAVANRITAIDQLHDAHRTVTLQSHPSGIYNISRTDRGGIIRVQPIGQDIVIQLPTLSIFDSWFHTTLEGQYRQTFFLNICRTPSSTDNVRIRPGLGTTINSSSNDIILSEAWENLTLDFDSNEWCVTSRIKPSLY